MNVTNQNSIQIGKTTVLVLEDEASMNRGIAFSLGRGGFDVRQAYTLREARRMLSEAESDIYICDITLPDGSGLDFVREIRSLEQGRRPYVVCLTALDTEADYVIGYEAGVDDYISKPFSLSVLMLKLEAYARRMHADAAQKNRNLLISGAVCLDTEKMEVTVGGQPVPCTRNELKLLGVFLRHPGAVLSRGQLLEQAFDVDGNFIDENTLAVNISRLREKLGDQAQHPVYIKNVRGLGYLWMKEVSGS